MTYPKNLIFKIGKVSDFENNSVFEGLKLITKGLGHKNRGLLG